MNLTVEPYLEQNKRWPQTGRHILAQFDADTVVVYQAYRPDIGQFAASHGYFGGDFQLGRMSWIKPNFLWMMFRCGWATKEKQECVIAVTITREGFDTLLSQAVHSNFKPHLYETEATWKAAVGKSLVRLQWDPDHHPAGNKLDRRAIQLGLRGEILRKYSREWIVRIEDISDFVREQHQRVIAQRYDELLTPREQVYPVQNRAVAEQLELSAENLV
ncbi:MAG: DUF4291 domain-containing protein [Chloroflexota bacterium]